MYELFEVTSWASARAGCDMQHRVNGSDEVEFTFGKGPGSFGFVFDAEALRNFIALAAEALADMDAHHAREQAEEAAAAGELVTTGEHTG